MTQEVEEKPSRLRKVYDRITGKGETRKETAWGRMHKEGGFIPLQNMGDTENRTNELQRVTDQIQDDYRNSELRTHLHLYLRVDSRKWKMETCRSLE